MIQLVYESEASPELSRAELLRILSVARRRNGDEGLTGMLLFHEGRFLQILEGHPECVHACFDRIRRDPRHSDVWVLARMESPQRAFARWSMGLAMIEDVPEEMAGILRDFDTVRARLRLFQENDPDGEGAYAARIVRGFLDQWRAPAAA